LAQLAEVGHQLRARLRTTTRIAFDRLSDEVIFFVVIGHRVAPLTPELVRRVLAEEGLAELFLAVQCPRHYWLTRALELR
jgi:hypothetical protein